MKFSESLKKNRKFREVYQKGKFYSARYLTVHVIKSGNERNYLGITVSNKVGNAVIRNRVTRLIRECYRVNEMMFAKGYSIVVVARAGSHLATYWEIEKDLLNMVKRHRIFLADKTTNDLPHKQTGH